STERPFDPNTLLLSQLPLAITLRMWFYPLPKSGMGCPCFLYCGLTRSCRKSKSREILKPSTFSPSIPQFMGCSVPIGFKQRRDENAPNAQSEVAFQAWSRPDIWRRMHNELDDRDELLLAWSTVAGSSWRPDHSRGSSALPSAIHGGTDAGFDLACAGSRSSQGFSRAFGRSGGQLPHTAAGSLDPSQRRF